MPAQEEAVGASLGNPSRRSTGAVAVGEEETAVAAPGVEAKGAPTHGGTSARRRESPALVAHRSPPALEARAPKSRSRDPGEEVAGSSKEEEASSGEL
jgi:hypothetical protein